MRFRLVSKIVDLGWRRTADAHCSKDVSTLLPPMHHKIWMKQTHTNFSYRSVPCSGCSLWKFAVSFTVKKPESWCYSPAKIACW